MANRHSHKKLRAEIHARMAETGESFQLARQRIVTRRRRSAPAGVVDIVEFQYFGRPMTIATWVACGRHIAMLLPIGWAYEPRSPLAWSFLRMLPEAPL